MKLRRRPPPAPAPPSEPRLEAERGRILVEESREIVLVLDEEDRLVAASRRARESIPGLEEGRPPPASALRETLAVPYEVEGRRETLVYVGSPAGLAAYEELRAGFTAAVSHELRTPLARLLTLLESAELPEADVPALLEQARAEVVQIDELIGDVLFLSELETGRQVVGLGGTLARPVVLEVVERLRERAADAGTTLVVDTDLDVEVPLRARMLRVVVENLLENAVRYAGPRSTVRVSTRPEGERAVLEVSDDGIGVGDDDLPRLFERFFRGDRARASRGTGLGLAIVKHVVGAASGSVEAGPTPGGGLTVRCAFPRVRR